MRNPRVDAMMLARIEEISITTKRKALIVKGSRATRKAKRKSSRRRRKRNRS